MRQGKKDGWWAVFDERGGLVEEHDFWQGEPTRSQYNWSYNRYECVENPPHDAFVLGGCLLDELTLTRDERLAVLTRAEELLHASNWPSTSASSLGRSARTSGAWRPSTAPCSLARGPR